MRMQMRFFGKDEDLNKLEKESKVTSNHTRVILLVRQI
jgi:hypothetical protein